MIEFLVAMAIFVIGMLVGVMIYSLDKAADKHKKDMKLSDDEIHLMAYERHRKIIDKLDNVYSPFRKILIRIIDANEHHVTEDEAEFKEIECSICCENCPLSPCSNTREDVKITFTNRVVLTKSTTNKDN